MSVDIAHLCVHYATREVLHNVCLSAKPSRVLGIIGPNGSGKSTLIKAVAGLLPATGNIHFEGHALRPQSIGYMPQDLQAPAALTVLEVALLGRIKQLRLKVQDDDLAAVREILQLLGIESLAGRYVSELSGGQRQMAFLAQALVSQPTVLLLDEPISALDICHQLEVLEVVRHMTQARRLTTLIVLHDLNAASRFCDDVALLQNGHLVACGEPAQVLTVPHIEAGFGVHAQALTCQDGRRVLVPYRSAKRNIA